MIVTPEEQPKWNAIIVDVLKSFIEICNKHGLTYYVCGGTAIGAVRHHGIIPWDDDIDVFMPRPDYDKFIELTKNGFSDKYELVNPYITTNYPLLFSKWSNKQTTLIEDANIPCIIGLYIDIFPLDGASNDTDKAVKDQHKLRHEMNKLEAISNHISFKEYIALLNKPKEWGRFVHKTIGFFFRNQYRRFLLKKMERICRRYDFNKAKNVMAYSGSYGEREVFPKSWLEGVVKMPFEGLSVNLFGGYDKYLHQLYGDYMQMPPIEKRISHHNKAYFNLEERVSLDKIKKYLQ